MNSLFEDADETKFNRSQSLQSNDNILVVFEDGKKMHCSRKNLASFSEYFRALLLGSFSEKYREQVFLSNVTYDSFQTLLSLNRPENHRRPSCCSDQRFKCIKDLSHAWSLMETADMLGLEYAALICDSYICNLITAENSEEIAALGNIFSRVRVLEEVIRINALSKYGTSVDEYSSLFNRKQNIICLGATVGHTNPSGIDRGLASKKLSVAVEDAMEFLTSLSRGYRFSHCFYIVGGYNFSIKSYLKCLKINSDDFVSRTSNNNRQVASVSANRISGCFDDKSYEKSQDSDSLTMELFEKRRDFPDEKLEDYRIVTVGLCIYITGGFYYDAQEAVKTTWVYDTREDEWKKKANFKHERCHHCAAAVNGVIYICGGYDGQMVHSSLEAFYPKRNVWISQPDMPIGVGNAACSAYKTNVFVICGQFGAKSIQTTRKVQVYNTVERQWSVASEYNSPVFYPFSEYGLSCAVIGNEIVMVGGQTVRVDAYNVESNIWRRLSDMQQKRIDACATTYRGRLLVAGGYEYDTGKYFDTVEVYNPEQDAWATIAVRLPFPVKNVGFCYVFDVKKKQMKNERSYLDIAENG